MPILQVFQGPHEGMVLALQQGRNQIGRDIHTADIYLPAISISRQHAVIIVEGDQYTLEDLQSRNGTYLNNAQVSGPTPLHLGDEIRITDWRAHLLLLPVPMQESQWQHCHAPQRMLMHLRTFHPSDGSLLHRIWTSFQRSFDITNSSESTLLSVSDAIREVFQTNQVNCRVRGADEWVLLADFLSYACRENQSRNRAGFPESEIADILREIVGNPFDSLPDSDYLVPWEDGTLIGLAQGVMATANEKTGEVDSLHIGILADALEDAGCRESSAVNHLRNQSCHLKECWVLNWLINQSVVPTTLPSTRS